MEKPAQTEASLAIIIIKKCSFLRLVMLVSGSSCGTSSSFIYIFTLLNYSFFASFIFSHYKLSHLPENDPQHLL